MANEFDSENVWGKSLLKMPVFTLKEIENHRKNSGKGKGVAIIKTLDRGRRFKDKRYITADSILTSSRSPLFLVKAKCKASMKNEYRNIKVTLCETTGDVIYSNCSCPAGKLKNPMFVFCICLSYEAFLQCGTQQ